MEEVFEVGEEKAHAPVGTASMMLAGERVVTIRVSVKPASAKSA
jgi:hypothetical protein